MKYLVIPDVHCREFWKEPVNDVLENIVDCKIIFLGDYLDGYAYEWEKGTDYQRNGIDNLKTIIELKKQYSDRIILLLGNHDCGYAISTNICDCRTDRKNFKEIQDIFKENINLFQLAYEDIISDKRYVFSHAGISKAFIEHCLEKSVNEDNVVNYLNNALATNDRNILLDLDIYDRYRGWDGYSFASPVWADIREWDEGEFKQEGVGYMIIGHTQLISEPIITDTFACLDCRKAFYIKDNGEIVEYKKAEN